MALQQRSPPEGGERVGQGAHGQVPRRGQVDPVHRRREPDQVDRALGERL